MSNPNADWQRKIDHRLRALWERVPAAQRARYGVRILLRFTGSAQSLKDLGAQVHSVSGDIASSTIALDAVPQIASRAEVLFIELAQDLAQDRSGNRPP